jgi:hypothetical protein
VDGEANVLLWTDTPFATVPVERNLTAAAAEGDDDIGEAGRAVALQGVRVADRAGWGTVGVACGVPRAND